MSINTNHLAMAVSSLRNLGFLGRTQDLEILLEQQRACKVAITFSSSNSTRAMLHLALASARMRSCLYVLRMSQLSSSLLAQSKTTSFWLICSSNQADKVTCITRLFLMTAAGGALLHAGSTAQKLQLVSTAPMADIAVARLPHLLPAAYLRQQS